MGGLLKDHSFGGMNWLFVLRAARDRDASHYLNAPIRWVCAAREYP